MSTNADDLTPEDRKKFTKFMGEFLKEDEGTDTPPLPSNQPTPPSPPPSAPPTQPTGDVGAQIRAALADHDKEKGQHDTIGNLVRDVEALKQRNKPKHWWFRPFSPMSSD